jgi:hypothetical protein
LEEETMNTLFRFLSHNSVSKGALAFVLVSLLGVTASALASGGISVSVSTGGISASATVGGVDAMLLRVGGPGDFFAETRSDSGSISWSLPGTAPDGNYRYEVNASAGTTAYRATGRFSVSGGQISEQKLRKSEYAPGLWHAAANVLNHLGEAVLDMLVPVAQAQDLTASSDFPTVFFDDTDPFASPDWEAVGVNFAFALFDDNGGTLPVEIDSSPLNDLSIFSDTNGDVSFGNDAVFVDRDAIRLGIGTITPTSSLHVMKADGTAQIFVEETSAAVSARNMFQLTNNGPIGFNMTNTDAGLNWRFAAQTTGFRVSLDGTGGPEMEVGNGGTLTVGPGGTGNLVLDGVGNLTLIGAANATAFNVVSDRNRKENFVKLDGKEVLAKLTTLPVTEWSFKGDPVRHIGPMAQDFKAAFGLGADDKHIALKDVAGVALVGVQALHQMIEARDAQIVEQQSEIAALKRRLAALEARDARVEALEAAVSKLLADRPAHLASLAQ